MHGPKPNSALRSLCSPAVGQPLEVTATQRSIALLSNNLTLISSQVDPPFLCCRRRRCPVSSSRTTYLLPFFCFNLLPASNQDGSLTRRSNCIVEAAWSGLSDLRTRPCHDCGGSGTRCCCRCWCMKQQARFPTQQPRVSYT